MTDQEKGFILHSGCGDVAATNAYHDWLIEQGRDREAEALATGMAELCKRCGWVRFDDCEVVGHSFREVRCKSCNGYVREWGD